jgi:hypothetical protein
MNLEEYVLFGHPYGVSSAFTNAQAVFCVWPRYRMYRRLGLTVTTSVEGKTLIRDNLMMVSVRARYGGQLTDGAAAAVATNFQS